MLSTPNFFKYPLFLLLGSVSLLLADPIHTSTLLEQIGSGKRRPVITDKLSEDELLFLTENYFRAEESIKTRFDNKATKPDFFIAEGITACLAPDSKETVLATALADLAGSLNQKQLQSLREIAEALAQKIRQQEPVDRDARLLALVERSEWLTYVTQGQTPPPSSLPTRQDEQAFERFRKEFQESKKEVTRRNREVLDYIKEAKSGNKDAKQWLRQRLDMNSFGLFMKGQKDFGGEALFEDLAEAMVWEDPESRLKYHDFKNKSGETLRVMVSKEPLKHSQQLDKALRKDGGKLLRFSLSPTRLAPKNSEILNLSGATLSSPSLTSRALPIFKNACAECHRREKIFILDFSSAAAMVQNGTMPPDKTLNAADKQTLIEFFLSSEPKEPLTELIR